MITRAKIVTVKREHQNLHEQEERQKEKKSNPKVLASCSKEKVKTVFFQLFTSVLLKMQTTATFIA